MSFEGYYLKKCKNNHIFTFDVYDDDAEDKCLQCNEKFILNLKKLNNIKLFLFLYQLTFVIYHLF